MTNEMRRITRSLATLNVLCREVRDTRSTLHAILNDAMLDDLEYLRDRIALDFRNMVALRPVNEDAPAADGNQDGEGEETTDPQANRWQAVI